MVTAIKKFVALVLTIIMIFVVMAVTIASVKIIPAGHKGVLITSPEGPSNEEINEGWSFSFNYMVSDVEIVEYRTQTRNYVGGDEKDDDVGSISVSSKDNILVYMDFSIVYHIIEDKVADLVIENGKDYASRIIDPVARSTPRDIAANYLAMDMRGDHRSDVEYAIDKNISTKLLEKYIVVEDFALRDIRLPEMLESAIEVKKVAEQNVLTQQYNLVASEFTANQTVVLMRAQAESTIINATATADATVIIAKGNAAAISYIMDNLNATEGNDTRDYLAWLYMQALIAPNSNIKYIIVPSDGSVPLIINPDDRAKDDE
jgi:regulator of protease activity HflC (stomatin/prohibitin superfamily)